MKYKLIEYTIVVGYNESLITLPLCRHKSYIICYNLLCILLNDEYLHFQMGNYFLEYEVTLKINKFEVETLDLF